MIGKQCCFILFIGFLSVNLSAQKEILLTFSFENQPLIDAFRTIEQNHPVFFTFDHKIVDDILVTRSAESLPVSAALEKLFSDTGLEFELVGKDQIIVKKQLVSEKEIFLCGKVKDAIQNQPLAYCNVYIEDQNIGTFTTDDGSFQLKVKPDPDAMVTIQMIGFKPVQFPLTHFQQTPCVTVSLSIEEYSFEQVLLTEYLTTGIEQSEALDHISMDPDNIKVVPGLTESDVLQMAQLLPGISSPDESAAGLHIRGGTPDQNLILLDGIPIYNSGHFFGMISAFNPYIVSDVDIYRSGFGSEYGGRVAGVIDIKIQTEIPEKVNGNVGLNFTHAYANVEIPLFNQKSALIISGRRSITDIVNTPTFNNLSQRVFQTTRIQETIEEVSQEEEESIDLRFFYDDANIKWIFKPNEKEQISLSYFGSENLLNFLSTSDIEEDFSSSDNLFLTNHGAQASYQREWNSRIQTKGQFLLSRYKNNYDFRLDANSDEGAGEERLKRNLIEDISAIFDLKHSPSEQHQFNYGYQFSKLRVDYLFDAKSDFEDNFLDQESQNGMLHTLFSSYNYKLNDKIFVDVGIRLNYFTTLSEFSAEPRFSARVKANKHLQFKLGGGWYKQFVNQILEFNDLGVNEQLWVMVDKILFPLINSNQWHAGFLFSKKGFQVDIEGYYKEINGLTSVGLNFRNSPAQSLYSLGDGKVTGVDILIKKRFKKYNTWVSYTFSKVRYRFEDINGLNYFPAPHDQTHNFTFVHQVFLGPVNLSLSWQYATGRPYTNAEGIESSGDNDGEFNIVYGPPNAERIPPFHRLDFSAFYRFPNDPEIKWRINLGGSILNLYNRENVLSRQFFIDADENDQPEVVGIERYMLGITPNFVFRFEF